jgi:hypothetical protein
VQVGLHLVLGAMGLARSMLQRSRMTYLTLLLGTPTLGLIVFAYLVFRKEKVKPNVVSGEWRRDNARTEGKKGWEQ